MRAFIAALVFCLIGATAAFGQAGLLSPNTVWAGPPSGSSSAFAAPRALVGKDLPNPSASTLGGIESITCATHQWLNTISTAGVPACAQPAFSDLSGTPTTLSGYGITSPLPVAQGGTAAASASGTALDNITGFASTGILERTGAGAYSFLADPLTVAHGGTGAATASPAFANLAPTPTRAGDLLLWNGSSWGTCAGNNSGTKILQEDNSGNCSWVSAGSGTVTSITIAAGTTNTTATCTITTSGTCNVAQYTQGTWTPSITTSGTVGTPAYTTQVGSYEQIGRTVIARFSLLLSGWTGSPTGVVSVAGLPFTASSAANDYGSCFIGNYAVAGLASNNFGVNLLITPNTSVASLVQNGSTGSTSVTAAQFGTGGALYGTCIYHV